MAGKHCDMAGKHYISSSLDSFLGTTVTTYQGRIGCSQFWILIRAIPDWANTFGPGACRPFKHWLVAFDFSTYVLQSLGIDNAPEAPFISLCRNIWRMVHVLLLSATVEDRG